MQQVFSKKLLNMKLNSDQLTYIYGAFHDMKSKEDLLELLNYSKRILYGENTIPFQIKVLTYYSNPTLAKKRYVNFTVKKKSGSDRQIHAPVKGLKVIQRSLNLILQTVFTPHPAAKGFAPGKSIVDNASLHAGSFYVYNIDLKDFFPSIDQARIWKCLQLKPFNLSRETNRIGLANIIASLCCSSMEVERLNEQGVIEKEVHNVLPQGAPTSPILTNVVCQKLDFLLSGVAKRFGLKYSRYADDITFSSMYNVFQQDSIFFQELNRIITEQGFSINKSKTRLQKQGYRQEVTGLIVNTKANVQKRYIKQLRSWLYLWETYGFEKAKTCFLNDYVGDKGHVISGQPRMENVIDGKLEYLKMVKGYNNDTYIKLHARFVELVKNIQFHEKQELFPIQQKGSFPIETLSIKVNTINSTNKTSKLKRNIIILKDETLPFEVVKENIEIEESEIDLSKHKPIDVNNFLLNFKSSEGLKFLTHDYDIANSLFDRVNILRIARKEFDDLSNKYFIKKSLYARIKQFAFGDPKSKWSFFNIPYNLNWNSPELIEWLNANPHIHPIRNDLFNEFMINPFKQSIEIKSPELKDIVLKKLAEVMGSLFTSFEIHEGIFIDLDKANFYTDVDAFQKGLGYLFKSIKQRFSNGNKLRFEFTRKSDEYGRKRILKIIHLGSISPNPLDKAEIIKGDLAEAEKLFFGICDWSIISKSPDDSVNKLNVLFDIKYPLKPREKINDSMIEGFTHILTFYS